MTLDVVPDVPVEDSAVPESSTPPNIVHLESGEIVVLHPKITIPLGIAALSVAKRASAEAIMAGHTTGSAVNVETALIEGALAEVYLRLGIQGWSFTEDDQPVPITPENIDRLLPYNGGGRQIAEAADRLYSAEVFRPLVEASPRPSETGPTDVSTSPIKRSGSKHPTPFARSSRNGTGGKRSKR